VPNAFHLYILCAPYAGSSAMQRLNGWYHGLLGATLVLAAGCRSSITNLTPSVVPRAEGGLYHFEAEWTSNERARQLRQDDIDAYLVIDQKFFPLERVPGMTNRWEGRVPLAAEESPFFYYYKWDYTTAGFGRIEPNSIRSRDYRLEIAGAPQ
jgi:hypothetical protein